jgi:hypothetical protein
MWNVQWTNKGYPSLITDPAPNGEVGGPTKIDSVQNVISLRSDLHDAWDSYKFAVNPDVCDFSRLASRHQTLTMNSHSEAMSLFPLLVVTKT